MKTSIKAVGFTALLIFSANSFSYDSYYESGNDSYYDGAMQPSDGAILVDLFLARPLGLIGSVVGIATQGVGLLFSVPGENFGETAEVLVEDPLNYTFNRPLGHFEEY
ncbi:MAG: hypothetical protein KAI17_15330 [Thiotrichaceae bacterium]|nr:hypothetical protein [Thiotrichaceae bacterium]